MSAPTLQFKRGLFANLPGLKSGEPGFTTDSYELYVGIDSTTNNNKFFGSHRYWNRETSSTGSGVNFVEGSNNGTDFLTIKAPGTLAGITTFILPGSQGAPSSILTNDGSGNLSWSSGSASSVFTGISTFSDTTDNTLGNENTGAVQIDGGVGIAKNLTVKENLHVGGNLYVNGSTTQVNTAALTVEDRTIDLGIVNGSAPAGATTWDLGILFNYYATTAKKSAVIWEHVDSRFKFASVLAADTDGSNTSTPQLTVTTFAPIEIESLFVNDCAGASQVISCTGTERFLMNITVDGGSF